MIRKTKNNKNIFMFATFMVLTIQYIFNLESLPIPTANPHQSLTPANSMNPFLIPNGEISLAQFVIETALRLW